MIEIPEAIILAKQLQEELTGKMITYAIADSSHHKFAWYNGDPKDYSEVLEGKTVTGACAYGGKLHLLLSEDTGIGFFDGSSLSFYSDKSQAPKKHQLLLEFDDNSVLVCTIRMYGCIAAYVGEYDNGYDKLAKEKVDVFSEQFTYEYFKSLRPEGKKLSVKGFLATEQRIPGLGNGVAQDIMLEAGLHPKRDIATLNEEEWTKLYQAVVNILRVMTEQGGRDVEKDIYGKNGGYLTLLSKNTYGGPCLKCGNFIQKEQYLGGVIYYCPHCQKGK